MSINFADFSTLCRRESREFACLLLLLRLLLFPGKFFAITMHAQWHMYIYEEET